MKQKTREDILAKRDALGNEEIASKSKAIKEKLFGLQEFQEAEAVMFYVSIRSEVRTHEMIAEALALGKKVVVPCCDFEKEEMVLSEIRSLGELEIKPRGLCEPKDEFFREFNAEHVELVIVPGIAFDEKGCRIGYGKGYYDKFFLKLKKKVPKIALAFDMQVLKEIPNHEHDQRVDKILTEERAINA